MGRHMYICTYLFMNSMQGYVHTAESCLEKYIICYRNVWPSSPSDPIHFILYHTQKNAKHVLYVHVHVCRLFIVHTYTYICTCIQGLGGARHQWEGPGSGRGQAPVGGAWKWEGPGTSGRGDHTLAK